MQKTIRYFHGLNSDKTSRKFLNIKEHFHNDFLVDCIEWKNEDNIQNLLGQIDKIMEHEPNPVIVGDSTGGNFAYQLKERRKAKDKKTILVLLNPLLDFEKRRKDVHPFPENIKQYLHQFINPQDTFLLISNNDEILDHTYLLNRKLENSKLITVNDTHRLPRFLVFIPDIEQYINNHK